MSTTNNAGNLYTIFKIKGLLKRTIIFNFTNIKWLSFYKDCYVFFLIYSLCQCLWVNFFCKKAVRKILVKLTVSLKKLCNIIFVYYFDESVPVYHFATDLMFALLCLETKIYIFEFFLIFLGLERYLERAYCSNYSWNLNVAFKTHK